MIPNLQIVWYKPNSIYQGLTIMYRADFEMFKVYVCANKQADYYIVYIVGRFSGNMCYSSEIIGRGATESDILYQAHKVIERFKYEA